MDITITSLETITVFDIATGNYMCTIDELQNGTIAQSEEKTDITGKQGRKLSSLKRNKAVTVSGTNGFVSSGVIELQTGGKFENKTTEVLWTDYGTVNASHKASSQFKAVGTAGAEIEALYIKNADGTLGTQLEQDSTAAAGKFAYDPANKEFTFHTDVTEGTEFVAYYKRKITADVLVNESDKYSGKAMLYIDALGEDKCANLYRVQFFVPKADFSGEFSLEMGDSQVVHNFEAEALAGGCGVGGMFYTWTVFGADAEDVA